MQRLLLTATTIVALGISAPGCFRGTSAKPISASDLVISSTPTTQPSGAPKVEGPVAQQDQSTDITIPEIPAIITDEVRPGASVSADAPAITTGRNPTTRSIASAAAISTGTYLTIGGVLAEVNGQPIYANRVLRALEPVLAAKARELPSRQFQLTAADLIGKQVRDFIRDEVEFAAAQRNLEQRDIQLAEAATIAFRKRKISEAGGSVEVARLKARENGEDFDQVVNDEYRKLMTQLYYTRKVFPRINVSASDIRKYYSANLSREFTENQTAEFLLIRVDPRRAGSKDAAVQAATALLNRAAAGEDFAALAASEDNNHDRALARNKGKVGPIERGAFRLIRVEEAVFTLKPGELTSVIEDSGSFYIAKLLNVTGGSVRAFEDADVQKDIREKLRAEQFRVLREDITKALEANAAVRVNESMMFTALEMASQRYPIWRGQGQ